MVNTLRGETGSDAKLSQNLHGSEIKLWEIPKSTLKLTAKKIASSLSNLSSPTAIPAFCESL